MVRKQSSISLKVSCRRTLVLGIVRVHRGAASPSVIGIAKEYALSQDIAWRDVGNWGSGIVTTVGSCGCHLYFNLNVSIPSDCLSDACSYLFEQFIFSQRELSRSRLGLFSGLIGSIG